ncbi:MAG: hypothetical protein IH889_08165 [Planctomycetes bacterium]|nr:hypothetical protein [Planctomycetota bacterium]
MSPADNDESEAELLKALLAERDLPCPVCGYNLRAIASTNCPECGAKLDLRVGSTDLKLGPWLLTMLAGALPLGFFVCLLGFGIFVELIEPGAVFFEWWSLVWFAAGIAVFGAEVCILAAVRRRFWGRPDMKRWRGALIIWLATISLFAAFLAVAWHYG